MEGRSLYNNIDSLRDNIRRLSAPAPQPTVDSRSRVALTQRLMSILQEDAAQEAADERSAARASQRSDVDPDAPSNPRGRGRTRHRETATDHALTLDFLGQAGQDVNDFQNLTTYASGKAKTPRASSPVTRDNKVRLEKAEVNYEAAKSQGAWARFRAASELVDAQQTYDDRIHLRQNQLFRARVTTDAANYVAEHPYQAAAFAAAVALTGGASAAPILAGLSLGTAGNALGGLAANDFRLQTGQDYLNVGVSAVNRQVI